MRKAVRGLESIFSKAAIHRRRNTPSVDMISGIALRKHFDYLSLMSRIECLDQLTVQPIDHVVAL